MVARGTAYKANIVYYITGQDEADVLEYQWMVSAKDRVGNEGEANSKKRFDLTIDTDGASGFPRPARVSPTTWTRTKRFGTGTTSH